MMVGGIVMAGVGVIGAFAGLSLASAAENQDSCDTIDGICEPVDEDKRTAGIVIALVGLGVAGGGIPLIIIGARKVPVEGQAEPVPPETALLPTLTVRSSGADLTWQF